MTAKEPGPPSVALWLLRHACPCKHKDALTGDLVERFREGQTRWWFWRQVLIVLGVGVLDAIRLRWPLFCYTIAGTIAVGFSPYLAPSKVISLHWSDLPWPSSLLLMELGGPAVAALASLPVLIIALVFARSFRWAYLVRTWLISLLLIAIVHFLPDMFPSLNRSIPGDPYHRIFIIPRAILMPFAFLIAGWVGCPLVSRLNKTTNT